MSKIEPPISASEPLLEKVLRLSHYARSVLRQEPKEQEILLTTYTQAWQRTEMAALLDTLQREVTLNEALRRLRKRVLLRLMLRDINQLADLSEVMHSMTDLAEVTIQAVIPVLEMELVKRYGSPVGSESKSAQSFVVVAMGKLGGRELNVSSDIDLIFCYPEEGETNGKSSISNHEFFSALAKQLIATLSEATEHGFVFRVDTRLRPHGDSGHLIASFETMEDYYQTQGRAWERYAWIKARVIYGDGQQNLMALMRPFVYRKYLDFGSLHSLRDLHGQIRLEIARRDLQDNIKLGPGGIREIEFVAQVFQLIRGGRESALQTQATLETLPVLERAGLLPPDAVRELADAYIFLRNLEHRLQYREDKQTHQLLNDESHMAIVAGSMGYDSYDAFRAELDRHRQQVTRHFDLVFATQKNLDHPLSSLWYEIDQEKSEARLKTIGYTNSKDLVERLRQLRHSHLYNQLPTLSRSRLDELVPLILEASATHPTPEETVLRMLSLIESISRREAYLALLAEHPLALLQIVKLAAASAWATQYLAQHPILLDELLDTRALSYPDWATLQEKLAARVVQAGTDTEQQMNILREFKHAQVFRLFIQDLSGLLTLEKLSDALSELADLILNQLFYLSWSQLRDKHTQTPNFAVIAYGKLGGKELGYASDLDLLFIYDDADPRAPEVYARLAQRINLWLNTFTSAGVLYPTDLRLRPDGVSGLLVSAVAAFHEYQKHKAWTWEHQALTRARWVAGELALKPQFDTIRYDILTQKRDIKTLAKDITEMREKILAAHPNRSVLFDVKHDRGGIVDVEFIVQYLILAHAHQYKMLTENVGNIALLARAADLKLIKSELASQVQEAYRQYRRWQHQERLQDKKYARVELALAQPHLAAVLELWENTLQ